MRATASSSTTEEYLSLLDLAYDVAQALNGKKVRDPRLPDCRQLAAKLFMHASSIYLLSQGTRTPVPQAIPTGTDFIDFPSVAVLTRAVIETYLNLFEVFFERAPSDEREFRYQMWRLSGFAVRELHTPADPTMASQVAQSQADLQDIRRKLSRTRRFKKSSASLQQSLLKGRKPHRDWTAVAKAAGFGEKTIRLMYAYYSGYAHADGLSGAQIVSADTRAQQIEFVELHMRTTMMVLSKMILDYSGAFGESRRACQSKPEALFRAQIWVSVAARLG